MGDQSHYNLEQALSFSRSVAPSMLTAAQQNDGVGTAEIPMATFVGIARALAQLTTAIDRQHSLCEDVGGSLDRSSGLSRDEWIGTLSAVRTMGGDCLADLLAPSEIAEIAEAVMAAELRKPTSQNTPGEQGLADDALDRLFAAYAN